MGTATFLLLVAAAVSAGLAALRIRGPVDLLALGIFLYLLSLILPSG